MIKWLIKLAKKILIKHGYTVKLNEEYLTDKEDSYRKGCDDTQSELESKYITEIKSLEDRIKNSEIITMEQIQEENQKLKTEHDRIRVEMNETQEYCKRVEKQVRLALHDDHSFSFARNMCFPGSSSVSCETIQETHKNPIHFMTMCGRTTMDDEATAKLKQIVGINQKYVFCLNYLMKLGLIDKIAKNLVNGGLSVTIGYNDDCTTNELYYEAKCMVPDNGNIIIK